VCKPGKGGALSKDEWIRHINSLRARNILVNTGISNMTSAQWTRVRDLSLNGVQKNDKTFTVRTDAQGNLLGLYFVSAATIGPATEGGGLKISERLIQDFKAGDLRFENNFQPISPWVGPADRGTSFNTAHLLVDRGKGIPGVVVMTDRRIGAHELYIAASYEENILMLAEANIYLGNTDVGLTQIDELRTYQGAGLDAVANTGLSAQEAKEELRKERRVALAFRGFSFYDARRWGVLENGRTGCVIIDFEGNVHTNASIQYGFMDYWDVPIAELFYNEPSADSAPVVNPGN
jgi:starch-binding outer membrane protein, SusD/RagB family